MLDPREQALLQLGAARGYLGPEAALVSRIPGEGWLEALVRCGAISPEDARRLEQEAKRTPLICRSCRGASQLRDLPAAGELRCPRCGAQGLAPALPGGKPSGQVRALPGKGSGQGPALPPFAGELQPAAGAAPDAGQVERIGDYLLEEELGRGSYGVVYRARRANLPRRFALKIMDARQVQLEDLKRFQLEARLASKLEDPGIVGVFDVGQEGDRHFYVMEYVSGPSLKEYLASRGGRLDPQEAATLVAQLARTVAVAHRQRIVHRDLKPANVMIERGRPRITDFGLAKDQGLAQRLTRTGEVVGSPFYMAPEQVRGQPADHRVDVYALGVILYQLITGRRPYEGGNLNELAAAQRAGLPPAPSSFTACPEDLERIVEVALAFLPDERYLSAEAFAEDLESFLRGEQPSHASSASGRFAAPPAKGPPVPLVVLALVLALSAALALGVALKLRQRGRATPSPSVAAQSASPRPSPAAGSALERARSAARLGRPLSEVRGPYEEALALHESAELRLELAELHRRRGSYAGALEVAGPLLERADGFGWAARRLRAEIHEARGELAAARAAYEELIQLDPTGPVGKLAEAARVRLAPRPDAQLHLRLAIAAAAIAPDDAVAPRIELGLIQAHLGRSVAVQEVMRRLEELAPDHPRVRLLRALLALARGAAEEALAHLNGGLDLLGESGDALLEARRVGLLLSLRRADQALAAAQRWIERDADDARARVIYGEALWLKGESAWVEPRWKREAVGAWREAFRRDATLAESAAQAMPRERADHVLTVMGSRQAPKPRERVTVGGPLLPETRQVAERRAAGAESVARDDLREALMRAMRLEPYERVREAIDVARRKAPRCLVVALERARLLVGRGDLPAAREQLASARSLGVDGRELDYLAAEIALRSGSQNQAAQDFQRLVTERRDDRIGLLAHAKYWIVHGDGERAHTAIRELTATLPDEPEGWRLFGKVVSVGSQGKAARAARREMLRGYALGGGVDVRTIQDLLELRHVELAISSGRRSGGIDIDELKEVLERIDRAMVLGPGPTLRQFGVSMVLNLSGPKGPKQQKNPFLGYARRWLEQMIEEQPRRGANYFLLGQLLLEEGRPAAEILEVWHKGLEVEPRLLFSREIVKRFKRLHGSPEGLQEIEEHLAEPGIWIGEPPR